MRRYSYGRPLWTYSRRLQRVVIVYNAFNVDIVQLSELLCYALPERPTNGLLAYLQRVVDRSGNAL